MTSGAFGGSRAVANYQALPSRVVPGKHRYLMPLDAAMRAQDWRLREALPETNVRWTRHARRYPRRSGWFDSNPGAPILMALSLTPELAATIRGARLVGTPLRACAKAAGVPWDTMIGWLRVGRAYNAAEPAKRNPRHVAQAAFAAELDRAGAQCESARFTPA